MNWIENNLPKNLNEEYTKLIINNSHIITDLVDNNPRQLKRFINNLIIAYETFADSGKKMSLEGIFIIQIIKKRLPEFYKLYVRDERFRKTVNYFLQIMNDVIVIRNPPEIKWINNRPKEESLYICQTIAEILIPKEKYKQEDDNAKNNILMEMTIVDILRIVDSKTGNLTRDSLTKYTTAIANLSSGDWAILRKYSFSLLKISNWETYDNTIDIVEDIPTEKFVENG